VNVYDVYLHGSLGSAVSYAVNVLPTTAPGSGTNTLNVFGADNGAGNGPGYGTNDIFLLRSVASLPLLSATQPALYSGTGDNAAAGVAGPAFSAGFAFVAVLHGSLAQVAPNPNGGFVAATAAAVELVNYDSGVSALNVIGEGGNDYFAVDDNAAITTLDAGPGDGTFQIGQLYGLARSASSSQGKISAADAFAGATEATTAGWLSRGNTSPLTAEGGVNDTFVVYSNQAPLTLDGGTGNNTFTFQGFAPAVQDAAGNFVVPAGCTSATSPGCGPLPAGTGDILDAPVTANGGKGFNTLNVLGTPFADTLVVTSTGVDGAGTAVSYTNIQEIVVDGLGGDNTIDVPSTSPGSVVKVIGGNGSSQVNVASDVVGNVFTQNINGTSATINTVVSSTDPAWQDVQAPGVNLTVAGTTPLNSGQGATGAVVINDPSLLRVAETGSGPIGTEAAYSLQLAKQPTAPVFVTLSALSAAAELGLPNDSAIMIAAGYLPAAAAFFTSVYTASGLASVATTVPQRSIVLEFTPSNWNTPQFVTVAAANPAVAEANQLYVVQASALSLDPYFNNPPISSVPVQLIGRGPAVVVATSSPSNQTTADGTPLVIAGPGTAAVNAAYSIVLASQPASPVTVQLQATDGTIALSSSDGRFTTLTAATAAMPGVYTMTFTPSNWNQPVLVNVSAVTDYAPTDPHTTGVVMTVTSGPSAFLQAHPTSFYVREVPNTTPSVIVEAPTNMIVSPAQASSYTIRLSMPPAIGTTVSVALLTDGQTNIGIGGRVSLRAIGTAGTGTYSGQVTFDQSKSTLTLPGAGSWLDLGFQVGELFQLGGSGVLYKVEAISGPTAITGLAGTTTALSNVMQLAPVGVDPISGNATPAPFPFAGTGTTNVSLAQWAATVAFDASNYATPVTVPVTADATFVNTVGDPAVLQFAKQPHLLSNIQGPLIVEGGNDSTITSSYNAAVMLPGEQNGPLFGTGTPPVPPAEQVNALNIFDDGAQADQTGVMTAMGLSGFGMGGPLTLNDNGALLTFPSGVTWGSLTTDPATGAFLPNASLSTVDTLNVMLGQGNDNLTIQGTPVPGPQADGQIAAQGGLSIVQGGGAALLQLVGTFNITGSTITRTDGLPWAAYDFAVGQPLTINGVPVGEISVINGPTLTVSGNTLTPGIGVAATVAVFAPAISSTATYSFGKTGTITRPLLQAWGPLGFAVGQTITVDGAVVGVVSKISGSQLTVAGASFTASTRIATVAVYDPTQKQVAVGGNAITITGGGGPGPLSVPSVTDAFVTSSNTVEFTSCTGKSLTCSSFAADGFTAGQVLSINGQALWTVVSYGGKSNGTLTVSGPSLPAGGVLSLVAYSPSPLVVLGSSTQDGVFYSGSLSSQTGRDFGSKPFPDVVGDGGTDFVYPVADPFRYQGNNYIDASAYFASTANAQLPGYGITIYGGGGASTIVDSPKAADLIAVSNSSTTVVGRNLSTRVVNPGGLNVSPITGVLAMPALNTSTYPDAVTNLPALIIKARGGEQPNSPTIVLSQSDTLSSSPSNWVTADNHPTFDVNYKLLLDGLLEPATQYANGEPGVNYTLYLNGILYTDEPFPNGTYTVSATITDFYGNTSPLGTAAKVLVIDDPSNPVTTLPGTAATTVVPPPSVPPGSGPLGAADALISSGQAGSISSGSDVTVAPDGMKRAMAIRPTVNSGSSGSTGLVSGSASKTSATSTHSSRGAHRSGRHGHGQHLARRRTEHHRRHGGRRRHHAKSRIERRTDRSIP
jgi:hypothetical protein